MTAEWPKKITIANIGIHLRDCVAEAVIRDVEKKLKDEHIIPNDLSLRFVYCNCV